ncbi:hypothetical protein ACFE04_022238 [Oxalis oulophora]
MASSSSSAWRRRVPSGDRGSTMTCHSRGDSMVMQCHCGIPLRLKTAGTPGNEGRRFYSCPNTWGGRGGCGLFVWVDNQNEKEDLIVDMLRSLKLEHDSLMKDVDSLKKDVGNILVLTSNKAAENKIHYGIIVCIFVLGILFFLCKG